MLLLECLTIVLRDCCASVYAYLVIVRLDEFAYYYYQSGYAASV
jgi:hypothetical protein